MIKATHKGIVEFSNYGRPYTYSVDLRETKCFWINVRSRAKYRKKDGRETGDGGWNQTTLLLDSIKPIAVS